MKENLKNRISGFQVESSLLYQNMLSLDWSHLSEVLGMLVIKKNFTFLFQLENFFKSGTQFNEALNLLTYLVSTQNSFFKRLIISTSKLIQLVTTINLTCPSHFGFKSFYFFKG